MPKGYDFSGFVTKNDLRCSDGVTIKQDAFKVQDGQTVPLVWDHNHESAENILGHVILHNQKSGVYGYGYLNDNPVGQNAKELVKHGDITAMSIAANHIKKNGQDVVHGKIFEVSLVLAGANPGALIDNVMTHNDTDEFEATIYTGSPIEQPGEEEVEHEDIMSKKEDKEVVEHADTTPATPATPATDDSGKTVEDVLNTLTPEQTQAVQALIGSIVDDESTVDSAQQGDDDSEIEHSGDYNVKHNVFDNSQVEENEDTIKHSELNTVLQDAKAHKAGSLRDAIAAFEDEKGIAHADNSYGIQDIESLFPEAKNTTAQPQMIQDVNSAAQQIVDATKKTPFTRVKSHWMDITADEARARGYIKGNQKLEQVVKLGNRTTEPQTVYIKQKLDRDDILDITDFDVVPFIQAEMRVKLIEELAKSILVGDGRSAMLADGTTINPDKIDEEHIRPIITDDDLFTIKETAIKTEAFTDAIIMALGDFQGSGLPTMYVDPKLLARMKLLKDGEGRYILGNIPSTDALKAVLGVAAIVPTSYMSQKGVLLVNLNDYSFGTDKGGDITSFDDFDIDFNQYKYLIETRLSGALTIPKSAIYIPEDAADFVQG